LASSSLLPKLSVEGSIPFARSNVFKHLYRYQVRRLRTKPKRFADGLQIPFLDGSPIWLVALPAMRCHGHNYITIRLFCETLSLCPRTHSFRREDTDHIVFCFAEIDHAEKFRERFGGDFLDPKDRPKWPGTR